MKKIIPLIACLLQLCCSSEAQKINGVSFVASRQEVTQEQVGEIVKIHANSAAVMPFGFMREIGTPEIIFDTDRQWFGETKKGAKQYIELLQKNGINVMLKPQIWVWRGTFTGTIEMDSDEKWKLLEEEYSDFILSYARLAAETKVPIFCIGTELERFIDNRPEYWQRLIKEIRAIYKGKLTYAANWDEYKRTPFWEELDYIGVDAYFPLSEAKTPVLEDLKLAWQPWKSKLADLSEKKKKPVLFTEFGYRSMDYTGKKPWLVDRNEEGVNLEGQANSTKAIFDAFWEEDWFAGGYVWKWFIQHKKSGGEKDNRFTPQNKPAQKVIEKHYKTFVD